MRIPEPAARGRIRTAACRAARLAGGIAALLILPAVTGGQSASTKPLLSKELHTVFQQRGAEATRQRYAEIAAKHEDEYAFDVQGLLEIASGPSARDRFGPRGSAICRRDGRRSARRGRT